MNLCVYATWSMVNLRINFRIRDFVYSEPTCIHGFVNGEPVYTFLSSFLLFTCYTVIFHLRELPSRTTLVSYMYHNANNLPLWHQGQRADQDILSLDIHSIVHTPPEYMLKSLIELSLCTCQDVPIHPCSTWAHAKSAKIFFKRITWLYNSTKWVWPSYDSYIHQSSNQVGIHHFDSSTQPSGDIPNVYTWLK